ncbi:hypothetical protein BDB01DRAFT_596055 [Pilobolus umbonatus]|nr:hypothetical protein BDB01DRAFT_596055 [Pilobolus umbonatus]
MILLSTLDMFYLVLLPFFFQLINFYIVWRLLYTQKKKKEDGTKNKRRKSEAYRARRRNKWKKTVVVEEVEEAVEKVEVEVSVVDKEIVDKVVDEVTVPELMNDGSVDGMDDEVSSFGSDKEDSSWLDNILQHYTNEDTRCAPHFKRDQFNMPGANKETTGQLSNTEDMFSIHRITSQQMFVCDQGVPSDRKKVKKKNNDWHSMIKSTVAPNPVTPLLNEDPPHMNHSNKRKSKKTKTRHMEEISVTDQSEVKACPVDQGVKKAVTKMFISQVPVLTPTPVPTDSDCNVLKGESNLSSSLTFHKRTSIQSGLHNTDNACPPTEVVKLKAADMPTKIPLYPHRGLKRSISTPKVVPLNRHTSSSKLPIRIQ